MPVKTPPLDLGQRIQRLVDDRQQHLAAIAEINQTLSRIKDALRPPAGPATAGAAPTTAPAAKAKKKKRKKFATTGDDLILAFIKANKNPTTQEIKQHWTSEGRGGTPDSALSLFVKNGKLKRTPLKEGRGSRYTMA